MIFPPKHALAWCALLLFSWGCSRSGAGSYLPSSISDERACEPASCLIEATNDAAEKLADSLGKNKFKKEYRIGLTSFVHVDRIDQTSTLGRVLPEVISARLSQLGFTTVEFKNAQKNIVFRDGEGEFALTRSLEPLSKAEAVGGVLIGTYTQISGSLIVNVRVVRSVDLSVAGGASFELPMNWVDDYLMSASLSSTVPVPSVDTDF